jgi:hypothetical protein
LRCLKLPDEDNYRSCRRNAPQEEQAFDIVDEVRQSDLRFRSRDPRFMFDLGGLAADREPGGPYSAGDTGTNAP